MAAHEDLQVQIEKPKNGWVTVTLAHAGRRCVFYGSFTPNDSITQLVAALVAVASFETTRQVSWNEEPAQHVLELERAGREVRVGLTLGPSRKGRAPSFTFSGPTERVVGAFLSALENLKHQPHEAYERGWRHPFPEAAIAHLRTVLRDA